MKLVIEKILYLHLVISSNCLLPADHFGDIFCIFMTIITRLINCIITYHIEIGILIYELVILSLKQLIIKTKLQGSLILLNPCTSDRPQFYI